MRVRCDLVGKVTSITALTAIIHCAALGCGGFVTQLNMPVDRHRRLPADAGLNDINLIARLQKLFGLIFNRLRGFHCRRLLSLGWRSRGLAYHVYYLLKGKAAQYTQKCR
jgi:hypothetical protein